MPIRIGDVLRESRFHAVAVECHAAPDSCSLREPVFILLIVTSRSVRLALSVIGLNLLSVGVAFGVLVAASSTLGPAAAGLRVRWRGRRLAAAVRVRGRSGLSMDYAMLVRGEPVSPARRRARQEAAATALGSTGGRVTSAALVMIAGFPVFATPPLLELKQLGVGLAAAIALDATIVRGLALPAALTLLGDRGLAPLPARASGRWRGAGIMGRCRSDRIDR